MTTVGQTDGNILAAIITDHTPRNHAIAPSSLRRKASGTLASDDLRH
jgi:hypothetical protein